MIRLERQTRALPVISIIPLIDILLILLVFFMVTSTYLDLNMLPVAAPKTDGGNEAADQTRTVLIRLLPDGTLMTRRQRISPAEIGAYFNAQTGASILLLPSPQADVQALVRVLDAAANSDVASVNVLQFEATE